MTPKKTKGALKFHQDWEVKYAVQICMRDPVSKDVTSVVCLLCTNFGRDNNDAPDRKQKRTSNDKYYVAPWRSDNVVSHLRKQHAAMWEEYKKLTHEEKKSFFAATEAPEAVNLRSFVQPEASVKAQIIAKQKCSFVIDGDIVAKIIVDLLLTPARIEGGDAEADDVDISSASPSSIALSEGEEGDDRSDELLNSDRFATLEKKRVLKMFVYNPEDDLYRAKVNSVLKLNLVAKFVAVGVSFCQASKLYHLQQAWVLWDQLVIMKLDSFVALCAHLIFSTSKSFSRRFLGPSRLDLMPETMQVRHILTSGCAVSLKVTFRIFTCWLFPCKSDTQVNTSST
jgi:hypothetical protein